MMFDVGDRVRLKSDVVRFLFPQFGNQLAYVAVPAGTPGTVIYRTGSLLGRYWVSFPGGLEYPLCASEIEPEVSHDRAP